MRASAVRRIVVRGPNWLGDVVMSTPGFRALRLAYPQAEIVGLVPAPLVSLLGDSPDFDEIWPVERGDRRGMKALIKRLARDPFDLGIVIPESISSAWLFRRAKVRHVVGFARDPLRRRLLHEEVRAPAAWGKRRWVAKERFVLDLMAAVGAPSTETTLRLEVSSKDEARLAECLTPLGRSLAEIEKVPPILLAPGASFGDAKCWPPEYFAKLASELADRRVPIFLVGTAAEAERLEAIEEMLGAECSVSGMKSAARVISLAGKLDLAALKALVSRAALVVANDAGTRHLAAAFGVPSVIFFGPTSVAKTPENLAAVEVLETEHDCRPCYLRTCPIDHRCLRSIGVDQALAAANRALDGRSAATGRMVYQRPVHEGLCED